MTNQIERGEPASSLNNPCRQMTEVKSFLRPRGNNGGPVDYLNLFIYWYESQRCIAKRAASHFELTDVYRSWKQSILVLPRYVLELLFLQLQELTPRATRCRKKKEVTPDSECIFVHSDLSLTNWKKATFKLILTIDLCTKKKRCNKLLIYSSVLYTSE